MRPQKFTPDQVITAIRETKGGIFLAAQRLCCGANTIHNYAKRYREVRKAIEFEKGKLLDFAESKLQQAIEKGEAWAICFILKTLGKNRGYVERQEQEQVSGPIQVRVIHDRDWYTRTWEDTKPDVSRNGRLEH